MDYISDNAVVVTTTFYDFATDNPGRKEEFSLRFRLAQDLIKSAKDHGYEVLVVDGSVQHADVSGCFSDLGAVVFREEQGQIFGRRQAMREGLSRRQVVAWTEPEKVDYMNHVCETVKPVLYGDADIVIPRRVSLDSYPEYQADHENRGNAGFAGLTGLFCDVWFGPKTFSREAGQQFFLPYDGTDGHGDKHQAPMYGILIVPALRAHFSGLRVAEVIVPYVHPSEQTELEEQRKAAFLPKREEQLTKILADVKAEMCHLEE